MYCGRALQSQTIVTCFKPMLYTTAQQPYVREPDCRQRNRFQKALIPLRPRPGLSEHPARPRPRASFIPALERTLRLVETGELHGPKSYL